MDNTTDLDSLDKRLAAEATNKKQRNRECFEAAYDLLEKHLSHGVPLATVRDAFNATYGLNVSPQRFRQLLESQRDRSHERAVTAHDMSLEKSAERPGYLARHQEEGEQA